MQAREVAERRGEAEVGGWGSGCGGGGEVGDDGLEQGDGAVDVAGVDEAVHLLRPTGAVHGGSRLSRSEREHSGALPLLAGGAAPEPLLTHGCESGRPRRSAKPAGLCLVWTLRS